MKYSKGIMWLDDCRIPFVDEKDPSAERYKSYRNVDNLYGGYGDTHYEYKEQQGRFTPNLLVCDDMLNDGNVSNSSGGKGEKSLGTLGRNGIYNKGWGKDESADGLGGYGDKGTNSRYYDLDKWFDKMLYEI